MPDLNDFHAFKSTSDGSRGKGGGIGICCVAWIIIGIVIILLISLIADGADWDAIDSLLGFGFLAFLFAKFTFS